MTTEDVSRRDVGLRSKRGPVLLAVMLCTALVAIDATILATAVPAVVSDLGGFSQFPWLFSVYLLAQAVSVPVYGKFADLVGRRPVMLVGIALFLVGSVLCGAAWSMPVLIAARVVQGLGAGAVQPMSMTILGDLYSVAERAKVQGYVASVWAMASVVGPTLGGVFSEYASWRWIFFVNLPVGALAAWILLRGFDERVQRREHRIDYAGACLLVSGCSLLVLALLEGGVAWGWTSPTGLGVVGGGLVLLVGFVLAERRAPEPILPQWVFTRRVLVGTNAVAFGVGALLIGLTSYVPTYAQGVLGAGPLVAGFALAAMTLGWPISAAQAGRLYVRIGFRDTALIGSTAVLGGSALLLLLGTGSSVWQVGACCFVTGLGFGLVASPTLVAAQSVVGWDRRGVVTATNMFSRSMGSAIGVAVFGAVANTTLASQFASPPAGLRGDLPSTADDAAVALDSAAGRPGAGGALIDFVRDALADASHQVFLAVVVGAVLTVCAVLLVPRRTSELSFD